ncbi:MAG: T9SS type A sorting domain-containing protein [Puia sp.]|nr:T9SS type A sorting domain-containing protein [Puia sp.]
MNTIYPTRPFWYCFLLTLLITASAAFPVRGFSQTCPTGKTSIANYPNTYYPGTQSSLTAGTKSITVGPAGFGATPISTGDILLIIQMQGATFGVNNDSTYGANVAGGIGNGYITSVAGTMEYVVATNSVPTTGGTLTIQNGLVNSYTNKAYTTSNGQYAYQLMRVPVYYDLSLSANITAPKWNGSTGGVLVLYAVDSIIFNGYTLDASGAGFRGGAGRQLGGAAVGNADYRRAATTTADGSKGEGIGGTPRYLNNNGTLLDNTLEGYPYGSYAMGAPGNAGGGATDGNPSSNSQNSGGGGGGNGGLGGKGGNAWSSGLATGGSKGAIFGQASPKRLVLGGGGGAGTSNDGTGTPGSGFASSGSAGGGLVIVMAGYMGGTGTINVNGANANNTVANDGSGGAGAGGSALVYISLGSLSNLTVTAVGGAGGSNSGAPGTSTPWHGPGGGGGGGIIYANATLNAASSAAGGVNGTTTGSIAYGASSGSSGVLTQNITQLQTSIFPSSCTILPLAFISVTANNNNGNITVGWEVSGDIDIDKYIVEKSSDGTSFNTAGTVAAKSSGQSDNLYNFTDGGALSLSGTLYYRIEAVDHAGHWIYSKTVGVQVRSSTFGNNLSIAPNPVAGSATISFTCANAGLASIRLVDMGGRIVWQKRFSASAGQNTLALDNPSGFANGIYSLQWSDGVKIQNCKVLINH